MMCTPAENAQLNGLQQMKMITSRIFRNSDRIISSLLLTIEMGNHVQVKCLTAFQGFVSCVGFIQLSLK